MSTTQRPTLADLGPDDAIGYSVGFADGYWHGYRQAAASQDRNTTKQVRLALGRAGHAHLAEQRRRLDADRASRRAHAAVPRHGDWPGLDCLTDAQREHIVARALNTWDDWLTCWCGPVPGRGRCGCGHREATPERVKLDDCSHGCRCGWCLQPLSVCRTRCSGAVPDRRAA